jgi:TetR/AcrR family transcriptional repressor of nem operon
MPYTPEHKEKTRSRILESARALFNRRGFASVSIDDVMSRAGLTRGGFYNHFRTKDELFVEAVESFMRRTPSRFADAQRLSAGRPDAFAKRLVESYLSDAHLEDIDGHCPMIALPSDVAHAGADAKSAFKRLIEGMSRVLAGGVSGGTKKEARDRGLALVALCVGSMMLARTLDDPKLASEIRGAARRMALAELEGDR